jgi:hypothetical protein
MAYAKQKFVGIAMWAKQTEARLCSLRPNADRRSRSVLIKRANRTLWDFVPDRDSPGLRRNQLPTQHV